MMNGLLEVIDGGIGNSIQDEGRFGYRHMGITVSGCLDPFLARCANALVGNSSDCACMEIRAAGPVLVVKQGPVRVAMAGELSMAVQRANGDTQQVLPWTSVTLEKGDVLETGFLPSGTAYLAVSGGIGSPIQLGSRSTYQRAIIGGIDGKPIVVGNLLSCATLSYRDPQEFKAEPWKYADGPICVIFGPQKEHFKPESVNDFLNSDYVVTKELDRMGMRLEGPALIHTAPAMADIVSDGVTPGAIQVPGNGQPIILLADCQTVGGYPKVATVISADMPRLAQLKPGQTIRFRAIDAKEAKQKRLDRETEWKWWAYRINFGLPDEELCEDMSDSWPLAIC